VSSTLFPRAQRAYPERLAGQCDRVHVDQEWVEGVAALIKPDFRHEVDARGSLALIAFVDAENALGGALRDRAISDITLLTTTEVSRWRTRLCAPGGLTACGLTRKLTICSAQSVDSTHPRNCIPRNGTLTPRAVNSGSGRSMGARRTAEQPARTGHSSRCPPRARISAGPNRQHRDVHAAGRGRDCTVVSITVHARIHSLRRGADAPIYPLA
jgi:hypothetical protein